MTPGEAAEILDAGKRAVGYSSDPSVRALYDMLRSMQHKAEEIARHYADVSGQQERERQARRG